MLSDGMPSADTDVLELANRYMYYVSWLEAEAPDLFEQVNEIIDNQQSLQTNALSIPEVEPLLDGMQECVGTMDQCQQTDYTVCFFKIFFHVEILCVPRHGYAGLIDLVICNLPCYTSDLNEIEAFI